MKTISYAIGYFLLFVGVAASADIKAKEGFDWKTFRSIAIQTRGRIKPLDTYSRETAYFVTGKEKWDGFDPGELIFNWLSAYEKGWDDVKFIYVHYGPLKKQLGIDPDRKHFAPSELRNLETLKRMAQEVEKKQQRREKLNDMDRKVFEIQNQLGLVEYIARGNDLTILPNPKGIHENWFPLAALASPEMGLPYLPAERGKVMEYLKAMSETYQANEPGKFNVTVVDLARFLEKDLGKSAYPTPGQISREMQYNSLRPFRLAWILYTVAFLLLLGAIVTNKKAFNIGGAIAVGAAFGVHIFGFVLRCLIAERPPVTNMYESVIWVTFGCVAFALMIWARYKNKIIVTAATVFALVGLMLADYLPSVLDPGIHPLEPVLRSNFWLTIHVLTITLSYAAFALSLCLGNVIMGFYLFRTDATERIQALQLYSYRGVQIGVVLITAGTILGGVWADYSWGRFWGWDPKEVWALIALLLYLAVLHGRFTGWLKGFGFAAATVCCFLGVLMAWYGVNFVLGAGLHSYGFGTGGLGYVSAYILLQIGFIIAAYVRYRGHRSKSGVDAAIFPKSR